MSKLAILMFGAYRTFELVAPLTKKFLLDTNPGCKIFMFCETDLSTESLRSKLLEAFGEESIGKVVAVKTSQTPEYHSILEYLLKTQPALQPEVFAEATRKDPYTWDQSYLRNSGSIIQYYQLQKCMDLMLDYEREHGYHFDLVLRTRPDLCLGVALPLEKFFSDFCPEIARMPNSNDDIYLRSLGSNWIAMNVTQPGDSNITRCYNLHPYTGSGNNVQAFKEFGHIPQQLLQKIQKGSYVWSLGVEQLYLGRRDVFVQLRSMLYHYGAYINPRHHCTFNSESFFVYHLRHLGMTHLMLYPTDLKIYATSPSEVFENGSLFSLIR